jgi:hypothetical protein
MVSPVVTVLVVAADIGLAMLLMAGILLAARAEHRDTGARGGPLLAGAVYVAGWFTLVVVAARAGVFESTPDTTVPVIGLGIVAPVLLGCVLLALPEFRERLERIPLHWLVGVQAYRVVGGLFLVAHAQGDLPAEFALPAGIGDVLVGLAAPFVARRLAKAGPERARTSVLIWCWLGLADLVVAVACGLLTAPSALQQLALDAPNAAITSYPLVIIPTFAVPVSILLHVYVIVRLRASSRTVSRPGVGNVPRYGS